MYRDASPDSLFDVDPLDELLAQIDWGGPDDRAVQRLRARWGTMNRGADRRRCALMAAAAIVAAVSAARFTTGRLAFPTGQVGTGVAQRERHSVSRDGSAAPKQEQPLRSESVARDPDAFERSMIVALEHRMAAGGASGQPQPREPAETASAIARASPPVESKPAIPAATEELQLVQAVILSSGSEQIAAARLLTQVATVRSVDVLRQLMNWEPVRQEATYAWARVAPPHDVAEFIRGHAAAYERTDLLAILAGRDALSMAAFLEFVGDREWRHDAMAALHDARPVCVETLFVMLNDSHVRLRMAAARALGSFDDARISERLIAMTSDMYCQREAMAALLCSSEPSAVRFVTRAGKNLNLWAAAYSVQRQLASLAN